jgi:hypothetical protein
MPIKRGLLSSADKWREERDRESEMAEWILSCVQLKHFALIPAAEMEADSFL